VCLSVYVSVCLCVLDTQVSCAETAEPIEMPFGTDFYGPKEPCIRWGSRSSHEKRQFWYDMCRPVVTCLRISALCIVRMPPRANVPAQRTRRTNAFAAARYDKTAMRTFAKLIWAPVIV